MHKTEKNKSEHVNTEYKFGETYDNPNLLFSVWFLRVPAFSL